MITLYYSPFFTGECYRNRPVNKTLFEKTVGDAGLLDFLELRLGLPGTEAEPIERILSYKNALGTVKEGAFYKKAFENDPLATAKEILRWRDLLVMEGFDADTEYKSSRLRKLAEVEKLSSLPGTPERWKIVLECIKGSLPGVTIAVCYSLDLIPKLIREILSKLGAKEEKVNGGVEFVPKDKAKISIKCFGTMAEAYRWAVDNHNDEAVICPDTFRLDAMLRSRNLSPVAASVSGDSSVTQLFRQGLSLLERPVDIRNLLEYLRTGYSPIPDKYRYPLARALKKEGGKGDEWKKALEQCKENPEVQTYLLSLLEADVTKMTIGNNKKVLCVDASIITSWCRAIANGANSMINQENKQYILPYLMELADLCNGMCRVIEEEHSETVKVDFVLKAVKTLYELSPIKSVKATANSWDAVDSHLCFIDNPVKLWWLPCNGGLETHYPYSFLLKDEKEAMGVKEMPDYVQYDYKRMVNLLGEVDEIVLFACDFDGTEALVEHPAVTVCKQAAPNSEEDLRHFGHSGISKSIFTPLHTIETKVNLYKESQSLSATSTETLIGFPFDFAMAKTLGFEDISALRLSDITPTLGTVAHRVFQTMLEDSNEKSVREMRAMLSSGFDDRVDIAANEKGEILLLPENGTLLKNFKRTIRESIGTLLNILQECDLKPMYSEETFNETLKGFSDITGSVDFHAETSDGRIVVIDFKYSKGKSYIEKLEEDKAIQLELYAEALEEKWHRTVVARAYYFFPINQLHTDDTSGIFSNTVPGVVIHKKDESTIPLSKRISNSKEYRQAQLTKGTLEIEEGTALDDIQYQKDNKVYKVHDKNKIMIDIPKADKKVDNKEVKANSPFANPTKYPILKNIIK